MRIGTALIIWAVSVITAGAQDFPTRPITLVVPFPAGGAADGVGRTIADAMREQIGQTVVIDNRVGGNTVVGMQYVSRAPADGYTLLLSSEAGQAVLPAIDPSFKIDALNEFTPLSLSAGFGHALVVRKSLGINSVQELIARAKAEPGKLNFGSGGVGTASQISMELLKRRVGIDMVHVPYRGSQAAWTDLIAGTLDFNVQSMPVLTPHLGNPDIKILAVLSPQRIDRLPDVPTMVELGFPGFIFTSWMAVFGPAGLPAPIMQRLEHALVAATKSPESQKRLHAIGFDPFGTDGKALDEFQRDEARKWKDIARETGFSMGR
jgi:tripartite-type tricarboxylate transporter receptor subunit TctC